MSESATAGLIVVGVIVLATGLGLYVHAVSVADKATIGRVEQRVETENFEQSVAYREGTRRDFEELRLSYTRAKSQDEKDAVLSLMRHRAAGCPPELVPEEIKRILAEDERRDK
jgi:hypothetical protein